MSNFFFLGLSPSTSGSRLMPFQATVQRGASQLWNRGLQGVQTVIERQESVLAKRNDDGLLLDGQDGGLGNCWTSPMICR
jgi:hypothetical protein